MKIYRLNYTQIDYHIHLRKTLYHYGKYLLGNREIILIESLRNTKNIYHKSTVACSQADQTYPGKSTQGAPEPVWQVVQSRERANEPVGRRLLQIGEEPTLEYRCVPRPALFGHSLDPWVWTYPMATPVKTTFYSLWVSVRSALTSNFIHH